MTLAPDREAAVRTAMVMALHTIEDGLTATDTDALKEAIRIARNALVNAYDTLTRAEQDARAKYWTFA